MDTLKALDGVVLSGITLRGTSVVPAPFNAPDAPSTPMAWTFTAERGRYALTQDATRSVVRAGPAPGAGNPSWGRGGESSPPPDTAQSELTRVTTLLDGQKSVQLRTESNYRKDASGAWQKVGESSLVLLFPPDRPDLELFRKQSIWSAGRGFAEYVDEITGIRDLGGGRVEVTAQGHSTPQVRGTWRLVVEPKAAYLVREADFTYDRETEPTYSVRNHGAKTFGACVIPERATWTTCMGARKPTTELVFESGRLEFDEDVFRGAFERAGEPYPANTMVVDNRTNPVEPYRIDAQGVAHKPNPRGGEVAAVAPRSSRGRAYALLAGNLGLCAAYFGARRFLGGRREAGDDA